MSHPSRLPLVKPIRVIPRYGRIGIVHSTPPGRHAHIPENPLEEILGLPPRRTKIRLCTIVDHPRRDLHEYIIPLAVPNHPQGRIPVIARIGKRGKVHRTMPGPIRIRTSVQLRRDSLDARKISSVRLDDRHLLRTPGQRLFYPESGAKNPSSLLRNLPIKFGRFLRTTGKHKRVTACLPISPKNTCLRISQPPINAQSS